jgi:cytochrome c-type biogenesis protein
VIELYIGSFVAGILTVLAPCILPLLPVIVGGGSLYGNNKKTVSLRQPVVITLSLVVSIIIFTLLLKFTTTLLGVPAMVWALISGGIIFLFGINLLFPILWEKIMMRTGLALTSNKLMSRSQTQSGIKRDILLGAALGPVFNSCSPTYALIVAVILPVSFATGLGYLLAYSIGLGIVLLFVSIFGRVVVSKLKWMSNPNGVFQKVIGILFVLVGVFIIFGIDKKVQTFVLERGWYDPIVQIEESLRLD